MDNLDEALVVITTTENAAEGERLAAALVERELAACVQIIPQIISVYRWQGKIESSGESLLFIKTTRSLFDELVATIKIMHSYQTPEILALPVEAGSEDYLTWLRASLKSSPNEAPTSVTSD